MSFVIKPPEWEIGGHMTKGHIQTPNGWLGVLDEGRWWVVTGVAGHGHQDFAHFVSRMEAEAWAVAEYERQVKVLMERWLAT